jgi:hypothetical protein
MKIPDWQKPAFKFIHPELLFYVLAFWTMSVAAGVKAYLLMTTRITRRLMHPQCFCTATRDSVKCFLLAET